MSMYILMCSSMSIYICIHICIGLVLSKEICVNIFSVYMYVCRYMVVLYKYRNMCKYMCIHVKHPYLWLLVGHHCAYYQ
mgnify:FL=1